MARPSTYGKAKVAEPRSTEQNLLVLIPCSAYIVALALFAFYSFFYLTYLVLTLVVLLGLCFSIMGKAKGPSWKFGACCTALCLVLGSFAGWYIHDKKVQFWYGWAYGERYQNVVPSELASAHADAAVVGFESEAYVDTAYSVGYTVLGAWDNEFCIAPIIAPGFTGDIQYFAAGLNCCEKRAAMWCDGIKQKVMHSGVVIFDAGKFYSDSDHYRDAISMATAEWDLQTAKEPLIVRFVNNEDVEKTINEAAYEAVAMAFGAIIFGCALLGSGANFGAAAIMEERPGFA